MLAYVANKALVVGASQVTYKSFSRHPGVDDPTSGGLGFTCVAPLFQTLNKYSCWREFYVCESNRKSNLGYQQFESTPYFIHIWYIWGYQQGMFHTGSEQPKPQTKQLQNWVFRLTSPGGPAVALGRFATWVEDRYNDLLKKHTQVEQIWNVCIRILNMLQYIQTKECYLWTFEVWYDVYAGTFSTFLNRR